MALKSYYEILGVSDDANESTIRSAFRKAIREVHPDLNPSREKSQRRTRELNIAMEVLTDPVKRKRYDDKLNRMGKAQANAEFEQPSTADNGQHAKTEPVSEPAAKSTAPPPPEEELDFGGFSDKRPSSYNRSRRKPTGYPFVLGSLAVVTGGLSAACVSILALWILFRSDPTGLIAAESYKETGNSTAVLLPDTTQLEHDLESTKLKLKKAIDEIARIESKNAGPESLAKPLKLATFQVEQGEVLPLTTGERLFSNRPNTLTVIDGSCFVEHQFSFVQVAMAQPSTLEIKIVEPGIVYAGFQIFSDEAPPESWESTDALFADSAGRIFRVYRVMCADKGVVSIPWAHRHSGAQILVPAIE